MAPKNPIVEAIVEALYENLTSPNETNKNFESANVVEGLYTVARAVWALTKAVERLAPKGEEADRE